MSSAVLRIQVATLSDVPDGESRVDGVPAQVVSVRSVGTGNLHTHELAFWDVCNPGVAGATAFAPSVPAIAEGGDARSWTFTPPGAGAGFGQTFGLELIVDRGLTTEARTRRIYAIPTELLGKVLPLFAEGADPQGSLQNNGSSVIANSADNHGQNWRGYHPKLIEWLMEVEAGVGGGGGGGSRDTQAELLFGTGADGDVVKSANDSAFVGGDYVNFTLDATKILTPPANKAVVILARTKITINGTINGNAVNRTTLKQHLIGSQTHAAGGGGGGGGSAPGLDGDTPPDPFERFHVGGVNGVPGDGGATGVNAGTAGTDPTTATDSVGLARFLKDAGLLAPGILGGMAGGDGSNGGLGGNMSPSFDPNPNGGDGGFGGGMVILVAPTIEFGAAAAVTANGGNGGNGVAGSSGSAGMGGQGGGGSGNGGNGGVILLIYRDLVDGSSRIATFTVTPGTAGGNGDGGSGGAGAGAGGEGGTGVSGQAGYVVNRQLTEMP